MLISSIRDALAHAPTHEELAQDLQDLLAATFQLTISNDLSYQLARDLLNTKPAARDTALHHIRQIARS